MGDRAILPTLFLFCARRPGPSATRPRRATLRAALLAAPLALALPACQSTGPDVLESAAAGPRQEAETLGAGAVAVAMLLPRSAGGTAGSQARDLRDGAAMALDDLGDGKLAITVHDTGAGADGVAAAMERAAAARLILGPAGARQISALTAAPGRPPALTFGGNGGQRGGGVFALETDAVDSALEAARAAAGAGRKRFVAVAPRGFAEADRKRLMQGLEGTGAALAGFVDYAAPSVATDVAAQRELLVAADGVMIFGQGTDPAAVAAALRSAAALQPKATLIGNLAWERANFARPELDGALVAMPDQSGLALVADRYKARAGRALTVHAAYGYDAVAVAAGIVRTAGPEALTAATLTRNSGFRGATGIFRFRPDGSVDRRLALYRVGGGTLQLLDPAPEGF